MIRILRRFILLAFCLSPGIAAAQGFFTVHRGQIDPAPPLVTKRVDHIFGTRYSIDVHGFVGMRIANSAGFAGGAVTVPFPFGEIENFGKLEGAVGVYGRAVTGERLQSGLFFGVRVH